MSTPVCFDEEDEVIAYKGSEKPLPPQLPPCELPKEFVEAQDISYARASEMDFEFLHVNNQIVLNIVVVQIT